MASIRTVLTACVGTLVAVSIALKLLRGEMLRKVKYVVTQIIYNLFLHPLAKFKGPPLWCMLRFPYLKTMIDGQLPFAIKAYHDQYGRCSPCRTRRAFFQ